MQKLSSRNLWVSQVGLECEFTIIFLKKFKEKFKEFFYILLLARNLGDLWVVFETAKYILILKLQI